MEAIGPLSLLLPDALALASVTNIREDAMQRPGVVTHFTPQQPPSRRYAVIASVGILHLAFIYALMNGLAPKIVRVVQHEVSTRVIETQVEQPKETVKPVQPTLIKPQINTAVEPQIKINAPSQSPISVAPAQSAPSDTQASAIGSTHSRPPYPPDARRLGQQGRVELQLTISAEGKVLKADIVKSSGFPELDQTAQSWVVAHWRYQPAIQGGVAVMSTALAAVKFDIKSAS